ncbi:MAG: DUF3300 domain-containing protein [Shewanella sp.]
MKKNIQQNRNWGILALFMVLVFTLFTPLSRAQSESNGQEASFSEAELAQMLAPIALYPDSLLTHILIASTYPLELVQAKRLQGKNKLLPTEQLIEKAEDQDWDPSVTALLAFPTVLDKLSEDLEWTQDLGDAFLQDEERMLTSIQVLRHQADEADSLAEMENMSVSQVDDQIIIEPLQNEIIYVPYYDPRVVYGQWAWYNYPPIYWAPYPYYVRPPYGHFSWHRGIHISFNYYFSAFHWQKRHLVVTHHTNARHYRHHGHIVTSHGAQKWSHKPAHRRGVAYRSPAMKHKYQSHRPSSMHTKQVRRADHNAINQVTKQRELKFSNKMHQQRNMNVSDRGGNKYNASYNQQRAQTHTKLKSTSAKPSNYNQRQTKASQKQAHKAASYSPSNRTSQVKTKQARSQAAKQPRQPSHVRNSSQVRNSGQFNAKAHNKISNHQRSNNSSRTKQRN